FVFFSSPSSVSQFNGFPIQSTFNSPSIAFNFTAHLRINCLLHALQSSRRKLPMWNQVRDKEFKCTKLTISLNFLPRLQDLRIWERESQEPMIVRKEHLEIELWESQRFLQRK
ncbi:hypothetical protein M8C21_022367, partial [Ambrosia artemisiifolia]